MPAVVRDIVEFLCSEGINSMVDCTPCCGWCSPDSFDEVLDVAGGGFGPGIQMVLTLGVNDLIDDDLWDSKIAN